MFEEAVNRQKIQWPKEKEQNGKYTITALCVGKHPDLST
jgi:hypothetical protein